MRPLALLLCLLPSLLSAQGRPAPAQLAAPAPHAGAAPLSREGELSYEIADAATSEAMPGKLTFLGADGTPDPAFTRGDIGHQEGDAVLAYNRLMSLSGRGSVRLAAGVYDIYVTRGPEWDLQQRRVRVPERGAVTLRVPLRRIVSTPGWLSADFHVHSSCSPDSQVPMPHRIYEFVADGVDMIVSTDHNTVCDYAPVIAALGAGRHITSAAGDELTTAVWGHFGAFPLVQDPERAGHGAILVGGRLPAELFRDAHRTGADVVVDVHHPRIDTEIGYFNLGQLDSNADRAGRRGFSYDFDAVEVLNGYQDGERRSVDRMIHDWLTLINHGHIVTATGNSDTHHLTYNLGGYPRNYVRVQDDRPPSVRPQQVARALKAHRSFFTTGPFVQVSVAGGGIGDVVPVPKGGRLRAEITVQAPAWIEVSRVILYLGGNEVKRWTVPPGGEGVRFHELFDVTPPSDSFVVVRVDGDRSLWPVVGQRARFDVLPLALTNPVFLDANGNGAYDPPARHGGH